MKTKIKRHSRSVIAVVLTLCMLVSCMTVGLIATDAAKVTDSDTVAAKVTETEAVGAKVDDEMVGYSACKVKGTWDSWTLHDITSSAYSVDLSANTTYSFVYVADNGDQFSSSTTISGTTDYNFSRNDNDAIKLKTTIAGSYKFIFKSWGSSGNSITVRIEFPANTETTTWTAVGAYGTGSDADAGFFGTAWAPTATANDMTKSGTTWSKTWNNVKLDSQQTVYYKVAKNHSWDTAYPAQNASETLAAGTYNITITYDESTNDVTLTATSVAKSTLTVASNNNATVTATYNGTTKGEGESFSNVPQGATITVNVTPNTSKMCNGVTYTYSSTTESATKSGSSWTFTMPAAETTVEASITDVILKKIYFNNSYTLYGSVYAYVYDKDSSDNHTYEYLGPRPGKTMTKLDNSNIWYIEVPSDVDYVEFISGEGYSTGEMSIPWTSHTYPKYTAPYGHNDEPNTTNGGTWGDYLYGSDNKRTNEYTVSKGSTMNASNLFTGITATMYDYYTDGEVTNGWINGIANDEYTWKTNGWKWNPYTKLNSALSDYASDSAQPKYGVTTPLYFGNLNLWSDNGTGNAFGDANIGKGNKATVEGYHGWNQNANNSIRLGDASNAVTGLSGKTLANDTIHYYSAADTKNENGAPMAMFDEDFLSGENNQNKALASILRTSSFPVRTETVRTVYCDLSNVADWWKNDNRSVYAEYWNSSGNYKIAGSIIDTNLIAFQIPSDSTGFLFYRARSIDADRDNRTPDLSFQNNNKYIVNSNFNKDSAGTWTTHTGTTVTTHAYYEFDSTNGKDNAFITNIDKTAKTANIDYYADSAQFAQSKDDKKGFFPFDYNNVISTTYSPDKVYLKTSSNWNEAGAVFYAFFMDKSVSPEVDEWVKMESDSSTGYYVCDIPPRYQGKKVLFARMNPNGANVPSFDNGSKWNQTSDLDVPTTNEVVYQITGWDGDKWISDNRITVPKGNGYADTTDHLAHDLGFGMKLTIPFNLNGTGTDNGKNTDGTDQTFDFSGDDDLWVFVDGKLVLDLGGAHGRTTGSINFRSKTVTATNTQANGSATRNVSFADGVNTNENYVHTMTIYYMERGMFDSNLKFGFSFHAIPNQFWIDKKIRTKDIINAGFYASNGQTGDASNQDDTLTQKEGRFISKFEASYQNESFTVTHKVGDTENGTFSPAANLEYTIDNDTTTHNTGEAGTYPIKHDLGNAFIGKFATGKYFNLKETFGNNKYVYTPAFSVWDQANNNQAITPTGNNTDGYTFRFNPTVASSGGIENTNIKARFENFMDAHTLTLTKELTNTVDPEATFTLQVLFDFENDDNYIAYPLYCDLDGVRTQLSNTGTIEITAGQILEIEEIPQNAKIKVQEVMTDTIDSYRYDSISLTQAGSQMNPDASVDKGVVFTMHGADIVATIKNKKPDYSYTIKYNYKPYVTTYTTQSYTVKGVFTDNEKKTYLELDANGQPVFQSEALKKTFVNNKAPYEDNFQETLSFANSTIIDTGDGKGWNDGKYTCEVTAQATEDHNINVYFKLPYAVDSDENLIPQESGTTGKVAMITADTKGEKDIKCFDWYVTSGKTSENDTATADPAVYVNAPLIVYTDVNDDTTAQYFQYWSVKTQNGYGMKSQEYTRCYDYQFDFALFMDCVIEPVYGDSWAQVSGGNPHPPTTYNMYERFDPELQITGDNTNAIKIAFLENSRNQYNEGDNGGREVTNGAVADDVVYSDFLLNFNYVAGMTKLKDLEANKKKAGLVVEAVKYMEYIDNTTVFDTNKDYSTVSKYNSNETSQKTTILGWLTNGGDRPAGCAKSEFDVHGMLDNKNCIQYYYSLRNRAYNDETEQLVNSSQNRYKVFRAYAYIGDVDGSKLTNVQISAPVYFTIYDAASNGLPDNATIS